MDKKKGAIWQELYLLALKTFVFVLSMSFRVSSVVKKKKTGDINFYVTRLYVLNIILA